MTPKTYFSTPLSKSARDTEGRIRNILQGQRRRPAVIVPALAAAVALLCGSVVAIRARELADEEQSAPEEVLQESIDLLIYDPAAVTLDVSREPKATSWTQWVDSAAVPSFLDVEQQTLYRRALRLDDLMFGGETSAIDFPELADEPLRSELYAAQTRNAVEIDGNGYVAAVSRYRSWADFAATVDSVYTHECWNARNTAGFGAPIYRDYNGRLAYIDASSGGGNYAPEVMPDAFKLIEKTDDAVEFIRIAHYIDRYGQTEEGAFYTNEFPVRMVRTSGGWRVDEFHHASLEEIMPEGWYEEHLREDILAARATEDEALAAYRNVLLGGEFLVVDTEGVSRTTTTTDVLRLYGGNYANIDLFAALDLDGDAENEVVLHVGNVGNDMGGYIVLHHENDTVRGYQSNYRTFWHLKTDGTFQYSAWSGLDGGFARAGFLDGRLVLDKFMRATGERYYDPNTFIVDGEPVSREDYSAAAERQGAKPDAEWYEFTEENVRAVFGG